MVSLTQSFYLLGDEPSTASPVQLGEKRDLVALKKLLVVAFRIVGKQGRTLVEELLTVTNTHIQNWAFKIANKLWKLSKILSAALGLLASPWTAEG